MTGRPSGRKYDEMRDVRFELDVAKHAEGSCMANFGYTRSSAASIENRVPGWLRDTGIGWITAEYGMLPRSTHTRQIVKQPAVNSPEGHRKFSDLSGAVYAYQFKRFR